MNTLIDWTCARFFKLHVFLFRKYSWVTGKDSKSYVLTWMILYGVTVVLGFIYETSYMLLNGFISGLLFICGGFMYQSYKREIYRHGKPKAPGDIVLFRKAFEISDWYVVFYFIVLVGMYIFWVMTDFASWSIIGLFREFALGSVFCSTKWYGNAVGPSLYSKGKAKAKLAWANRPRIPQLIPSPVGV